MDLRWGVLDSELEECNSSIRGFQLHILKER
jgi:hypothetical protein